MICYYTSMCAYKFSKCGYFSGKCDFSVLPVLNKGVAMVGPPPLQPGKNN